MESTAPARGEARWPMAAAVLAGLVLLVPPHQMGDEVTRGVIRSGGRG